MSEPVTIEEMVAGWKPRARSTDPPAVAPISTPTVADVAELYGWTPEQIADYERKSAPAKRPKEKKPAAKRRGRFAVLNTFVDSSIRELTLSPDEAMVWAVLYRDSRDGYARTAQSDIARRINVSRRTVVRVVTKLESLGLVRVVYRGGMPRRVSKYKVRGAPKRGKLQVTPATATGDIGDTGDRAGGSDR
jgi:DNA-binding transcriptional ArsR family regulator